MRRLALVSLPLLTMAGPSAASSFISPPSTPHAASPSIISLGEASAPAIEAQPVAAAPAGSEILALSPSIFAFGADAIPVANEDVASIPKAAKPAWMSSAQPLVIRGGEHGNAFASPRQQVAAAPSPKAAEPVAEIAEPAYEAEEADDQPL